MGYSNVQDGLALTSASKGWFGPTGGSRQIFVDNAYLPYHRAVQIAETIEDEFLRVRPTVGQRVGLENDFASQFGVGRNVIREAFNVLEARGVAAVRRGPTGGLVVMTGERSRLVNALAWYLHLLNLPTSDIQRAAQVVSSAGLETDSLGKPTASSSAYCAKELALEVFARCQTIRASGFDERSMTFRVDKQAVNVMLQIIRDITPERCRNGEFLGSMQDLADRLCTDRRILTQAVRLTAEFGVLDMRRGRTGGLYLQTPKLGALMWLVHGHLMALNMKLRDMCAFLWIINIAHARIAAQRHVETRAMRGLVKSMTSSGPEETYGLWIRLQQLIANEASSPALNLFAHCIASFNARLCDAKGRVMRVSKIDELAQASRGVIDAIDDGDFRGVEAAQARCHRLVEESFRDCGT